MKGSKGIKILVAVLIILIIVAGVLLFLKMKNDGQEGSVTVGEVDKNANKETKVVEVEEPKIFAGNDRPIAVMIDNHKGALPQAGLNKAYLVYEIIVEGGETRLMALFKNVDVEKIGPVRSARHYFLDYALENDAIYTHFGWSPQAQSDIKKLSVENVNGLYYDSGYKANGSFWRVRDKSAPHNAVTSIAKIKKLAGELKYKTVSTKKSVLNYVAGEVDLKNREDKMEASVVTIPYSTSSNTVKYEYDAVNKNYVRYSKGTKQVDWDTKEAVTTKNIIIVKVKNTTLEDGENKDRQTLDNVKKLEGYYITGGEAIPITAEKSSRDSQTVYKDLQGKTIEVSDGNTFIQMCPIDSKVTIEASASL